MTRHLATGAVPGFVFAGVLCLALQVWLVAVACLALAGLIAWRWA